MYLISTCWSSWAKTWQIWDGFEPHAQQSLPFFSPTRNLTVSENALDLNDDAPDDPTRDDLVVADITILGSLVPDGRCLFADAADNGGGLTFRSLSESAMFSSLVKVIWRRVFSHTVQCVQEALASIPFGRAIVWGRGKDDIVKANEKVQLLSRDTEIQGRQKTSRRSKRYIRPALTMTLTGNHVIGTITWVTNPAQYVSDVLGYTMVLKTAEKKWRCLYISSTELRAPKKRSQQRW